MYHYDAEFSVFFNSPKIQMRTWRGAQSERECQGLTTPLS